MTDHKIWCKDHPANPNGGPAERCDCKETGLADRLTDAQILQSIYLGTKDAINGVSKSISAQRIEELKGKCEAQQAVIDAAKPVIKELLPAAEPYSPLHILGTALAAYEELE